MSQRFASNLRFLAALSVAAAASLFSNPRDSLLRVRSALLLFGGVLRKGAFVDDATAAKRLETCRACPVFYAPLQTCGSPLRRDLRGLGCYCAMEQKTRLWKAQCWLDELAERDGGDIDPHGWKANVVVWPNAI